MCLVCFFGMNSLGWKLGLMLIMPRVSSCSGGDIPNKELVDLLLSILITGLKIILVLSLLHIPVLLLLLCCKYVLPRISNMHSRWSMQSNTTRCVVAKAK